MSDQEPLSLRSLSRELNIAIGWLRAEADAGRIPCLRAGRRRLFNVEAVRLALLRRAASEAASPAAREARREEERS